MAPNLRDRSIHSATTAVDIGAPADEMLQRTWVAIADGATLTYTSTAPAHFDTLADVFALAWDLATPMVPGPVLAHDADANGPHSALAPAPALAPDITPVPASRGGRGGRGRQRRRGRGAPAADPRLAGKGKRCNECHCYGHIRRDCAMVNERTWTRATQRAQGLLDPIPLALPLADGTVAAADPAASAPLVTPAQPTSHTPHNGELLPGDESF